MPRLPPVEKLPHTRLRRDVLAGRRIFGRHLRPVAFELLGDELGEAGERPLAHLGAGDPDDDGVVGPDHNPRVDLRRDIGGNGGRAERDAQAERQAATGSGGADQEGAAIDLEGTVHHGVAQ